MKLWPLVFALLWQSGFAETPAEKGLRIAKEMEAENIGFNGESSKMKMILIDAHGSRVEREMRGKVMEVKDDGDKSLITFESPLDVRGTKMLTWSHKEQDDDQWLYLPSVRRVKRITSRNQSASFLGSEFSYEDLGSQEIDKFNYLFLRDDKLADKDIWVLERTPKKSSGYSKQIMYILKDIKTPVKVEYFDRRGELLKTAIFSKIKPHQHGGRTFHRAGQIHMKNVQTQKESIFEWTERTLGVAHNDADFEQRALR